MFFANDNNGTRVYIKDADINEQYFCPVCGQPVIQRKGTINAFHYAHMKNNELCDTWSYDMTEWHMEWQNQFPEECREIVVEVGGKKHRADVKVGNTIIEFQHSRMSNDEFKERNDFYTKAGYNVVWLFDLIEENELNRVEMKVDKEWNYRWKYPWRTFDGFVPRNHKDIKVYFQMSEDVSEGSYGIEHLVWRSPDGRHFITKDGEAYDMQEFVDMFVPKSESADEKENENEENRFTVADIYDTLIEIEGVYYPCFSKGNGGTCYENCDTCKFSIINIDSIGKEYHELYYKREAMVHAPYVSGCLYRFQDIIDGWEINNDKVINITYDNEGKILELEVIKSGERINKKYERAQRVGKTLLELLRESSANVIGAINLQTGVRVKVGNSDYFKSNRKIYKIEGYFGGTNTRGYSNRRGEIFRWNNPEWLLEWKK